MELLCASSMSPVARYFCRRSARCGERNCNDKSARVNTMIRVLHFAGIINRHDFIDEVLSRLDRDRFEISALRGVPARRQGPYENGSEYAKRTLNLEPRPGNYRKLLLSVVREIRTFRPHI